jgi:methylmalonyl-CoA mutase
LTGPRLFEEFPPVETSRWMEVVARDLKGQDFDKKLVTITEDGIPVRPIYRKEDLGPEMPAARGASGDGRESAMREEIRSSSLAEANAHALKALDSGAEEVSFYTYPIGAFLSTKEEMERLLEGVYIEMAPVHWLSGPFSPAVLRLYIEVVKDRGLKREEIRGSIDLDPIMDRAAGWVSGGFAGWREPFRAALELSAKELPSFGSFVVRGSMLEKAGASLAQEIAFSASLLAEYLEEASSAGFDLKDTVQKAEIRLGVGQNYLLEIAKLRAARVVFANVLAGFGVSEVQPKIHAITTGINKTLFDAHNNLLRATMESMSAVIGGCDSLSVATFDQGYHDTDEFSRHLARNTEILLKEEAHLNKVADPLGGSYAIESLTASIAQAAWDLFQKVQDKGGFCAAWEEGFIPSELSRVRAQKLKAATSRRNPLVGTSIYPNPKEKKADSVQPRKGPRVAANILPETKDLALALSEQEADMGSLTPLRLAQPFEDLRLAVERSPRVPVVQLLLTGSVAMRKARAGFCQSFFGCAGLDIRESALSDVLPEGDLYVLCSSDDEYLAMAKTVLALQPQAPVWVAGLPQEALEDLKAAGVADFVHARLNPVETLTSLLPTLGVDLNGVA